MGIPRLRVLRGFQPHTDVCESLFGLATPFQDLSELRSGHTEVDDLGKRGLPAHRSPDHAGALCDQANRACLVAFLLFRAPLEIRDIGQVPHHLIQAHG